MSFEIFIQGFAGGAPAGIELGELLGVIGSRNIEHESDGEEITLQLTGGPVSLDASIDDDIVYALAVERPPADPHFWELILAVLKAGPYVLFSTGGERLIHGGKVSGDDLPEDMDDAVSGLVSVARAEELVMRLQG